MEFYTEKTSIENDTAVSVSIHWPVLQFAVDRFAIYSRQVCNCKLQDMKVAFRGDDRAMHNILYCKLNMTGPNSDTSLQNIGSQ